MVGTSSASAASRMVLLAVVGLLLATTASLVLGIGAADAKPCDPYVKNCKPTVKPTITFTSLVPTDPGDDSSTQANRRRLPFTGADLTLFAATGAAAIGTGTILVRAARGRKRR